MQPLKTCRIIILSWKIVTNPSQVFFFLKGNQGTWLAQPEEHVPLGRGLVNSSPTLGAVFTKNK